MYYIRINENNPNKLVYYCRKCGNEDTLFSADNISITQTELQKSEQTFSHIINKYTKLDPTLPRTNKVLCPNKECETNTRDLEREIIYIRYDNTDMKYVYLCPTCDTVWKTNSDSSF
jgi:DNA-directed RNA polymerase subunit M/transcription elongation factor TFIIS